jgi:fatty acid desaturase
MKVPVSTVKELLTEDQLRSVTRRSDLQAWWQVICQWSFFAAIFAVVGIWTNPITVILGVVLLGGRHLGFGVIVHECGHRSFFRTSWLNLFVGRWLASPMIFNNVDSYMKGHLFHHKFAGTHEDPDLPNYQDYPIAKTRFKRKIKRDLTGQTGWRSLKSIGRGLAKLGELPELSRASLLRGVAANSILLLILVSVGEGWLYLMWAAAYVFMGPLISRIRQVAEHAAVPDLYDLDPRKNTRTIRANPLWRLVMCPHFVNYHLEHHMLASVPNYNLKKLHKILVENGYYDGVDFPRGYFDLLSRVLTPQPGLLTS